MNEEIKFYVVDADGRRIFKKDSDRKCKLRDKPPRKPKHEVSKTNLEELEDAVFHDPSYRLKFLNMISGAENEEFDNFLANLKTRRERTLYRCWTDLKWRPTKNKKSVMILLDNPYKRKKS